MLMSVIDNAVKQSVQILFFEIGIHLSFKYY
jgi:hypothetical protein